MTLLWIFLLVFNGYSAVASKEECDRECVIFNVPYMLCAPDVSKVTVTPHYEFVTLPQFKNLLTRDSTVFLARVPLDSPVGSTCAEKPEPCDEPPEVEDSPKCEEVKPEIIVGPQTPEIIKPGPSQTDHFPLLTPTSVEVEDTAPQTTQDTSVLPSFPVEETEVVQGKTQCNANFQPGPTLAEPPKYIPKERPEYQPPPVMSTYHNPHTNRYREQNAQNIPRRFNTPPESTYISSEYENPTPKNSPNSNFDCDKQQKHKPPSYSDYDYYYPPLYVNPRYLYELASLYPPPPKCEEDIIWEPPLENCYPPSRQSDLGQPGPVTIITNIHNKDNQNGYSDCEDFVAPPSNRYNTNPIVTQKNQGYSNYPPNGPNFSYGKNSKDQLLIPVATEGEGPAPIYVDPEFLNSYCSAECPLSKKKPPPPSQCPPPSTKDFDIDFTKFNLPPPRNGPPQRPQPPNYERKVPPKPIANSPSTRLPPNTKDYGIDFTNNYYSSPQFNPEPENNAQDGSYYTDHANGEANTQDDAYDRDAGSGDGQMNEEKTEDNSSEADETSPTESKANDETNSPIPPANSGVVQDERWRKK